MLELLAPRDMPLFWGRILAAIGPALARERRSSWDILDGLMDRRLEAWLVSGDADGFVLSSVGHVAGSDIKACWLIFAGGAIKGGIRERIAVARRLLALFETLARRCGCREMRLETRLAWRHVLFDYDRHGQSGPYTFFRKALQ